MKSITSNTGLTQTMFVGISGRLLTGGNDKMSEIAGNVASFNGLDNNATRNAFLVGQLENAVVSSFKNADLKKNKKFLRQAVTFFK